jgi:hypothetical protein
MTEIDRPPVVTPPPVQPHARKSSPARPLAMLLGGGVVLAFGGCALFLNNINSSGTGTLPIVFGGAFAIGLLMTLAGIVYGIVVALRAAFGKR